MYVYRVKVRTNLPYPIEEEYRINCWKLWTAMSRGSKLFRAEDKVKGKKLSDITVSAERIGVCANKNQNEPEVIEQEEEYIEKELTETERKQLEEEIAKNTVILKS